MRVVQLGSIISVQICIFTFFCFISATWSYQDSKCPLDPITALYPDPQDPTCSRYLLCHKGYAFPRICPFRSAFHPQRRECFPRNLIPDHVCIPAVECTQNGFMKDPEDCTRYFICFYRQATHFSCLEDYVYDEKSQRCVRNKSLAKKCSSTNRAHLSRASKNTTVSAVMAIS